MRTKDFVAAIEAAVLRAFGERLDFETLPYLDDKGEPQECLGIVIVKKWHFATIVAHAAKWIIEDPDNVFDSENFDTSRIEDAIDRLEDFANLVAGMRVAPYMQWTAIYFPGLTEEQVLGADEIVGDRITFHMPNEPEEN